MVGAHQVQTRATFMMAVPGTIIVLLSLMLGLSSGQQYAIPSSKTFCMLYGQKYDAGSLKVDLAAGPKLTVTFQSNYYLLNTHVAIACTTGDITPSGTNPPPGQFQYLSSPRAVGDSNDYLLSKTDTYSFNLAGLSCPSSFVIAAHASNILGETIWACGDCNSQASYCDYSFDSSRWAYYVPFGVAKSPCETGLHSCSQGSTCIPSSNSTLGYTCKCPVGYTYANGQCTDVNECSNSPCGSQATCTNTQGSFTCTCNSGYKWDGVSTCADVNECYDNPCDYKATCVNKPGTFGCTCNVGFTGNGFSCSDINECDGNPCSQSATCQNTVGSYLCACNSGFSGNGVSCVDVNECSRWPSPCSTMSVCQNVPGSYSCACNRGYIVDSTGRQCNDIDECASGSHTCSSTGSCRNKAGSFQCTCNPGYTGNGVSCIDIDECVTNPCDDDATCSNAPGSFRCACKDGYAGDGRTCSDVNECNQPDVCGKGGICDNTRGSFTCTCNIGYYRENGECKPADYCLLGIDKCGANTECNTTAKGQYECPCLRGYEKASTSNMSCQDIDECSRRMYRCSESAHCVNTVGGYRCDCNKGYHGNGVLCYEDDECALKTHQCHTMATCKKVPGTYQCKCRPGFDGDGRTVCKATGFCSLQVAGTNTTQGPVSVSVSDVDFPTGWLRVTLATDPNDGIYSARVAAACSVAALPGVADTRVPQPDRFSSCDSYMCSGEEHATVRYYFDTFLLNVKNLGCRQLIVAAHYRLESGRTGFGCGGCLDNAPYCSITLSNDMQTTSFIPFTLGYVSR